MALPPDWSLSRTNEAPFPFLHAQLLEDTIKEGSKQMDRYNSVSKRSLPKVVPFGPEGIEPLEQGLSIINNSARRLEVTLFHFIHLIHYFHAGPSLSILCV